MPSDSAPPAANGSKPSSNRPAPSRTSPSSIRPGWPRLPELERFAGVRQRVITSLVDEIVRAVHAESPSTSVVYLDPCGATLGYATGRPATDRTALSIGWRDGIDLPAIGSVVDGVGAIGYFAELERLERELAAYRGLGHAARSHPAPDVPRLTLRERAGREGRDRPNRIGAADLSFYHYGFMRLESLDWIRAALLPPEPAE